MSNRIERDWTTEAGLRAVCLLVLHHDSDRPSHRCGYVCLPIGHPLHGKRYNDNCESLDSMLERLKATPMAEIEHLMSFRRMLSMLGAGAEPSPEFVFSVHGGLTYSSEQVGGDYPAETSDGWWFGFDCMHSGDGLIERSPHYDSGTCFTGPARSLDYVVSECESLAAQLAMVVNEEATP